MTESFCSVCKLLGTPPARVNFIVAAGLSDCLVYQRMLHILKNYGKENSAENDVQLTNYETLININNQLFNQNNNPSSDNQTASVKTQTCCHGFALKSSGINDISDSSHIDKFQKLILNLLSSKSDEAKVEKDKPTTEPESWIMFHGSEYFEPKVLNVFLQLNNQDSSLSSYTFTVLCFLMNEQRLFENWYFRDDPIQDYHENTYPEYESAVKRFFSLLNSSKELQKSTLLINEQDVLTNDELQTLLKVIFRNSSSTYRAYNDKLRSYMSKLLSPRQRTARDIFRVRNNLHGYHARTVKDRLRPLLDDLKQKTTAAQAAREVCRIVLDEFDRINDEEGRVYRRQLTLGFQSTGAKSSNTIAAQLVHCAVYFLKTKDDTLNPLIYAMVLSVCRLGSHFIFRHELFNNTPEIFTLSLALVTQRQYSLVLCGLRLCVTILDGDQIEHKYALAFVKHDPCAVRKILDAVRWIFSPYLVLKNLWKKEEEIERKMEENEKDKSDSESGTKASPIYIAEKSTFEHTCILLGRPYIKGIASLLYASATHCAQVTEEDIQNFSEFISVLDDPRMIRGGSLLISHLCSLLIPILLYGIPSVSRKLSNESHLAWTIPRAVSCLLKSKSIEKETVNTCIRFYMLFVQSICKNEQLDDESSDEESTDSSKSETHEETTEIPVSLENPQDLISSYFDLQRSIQKMLTSNEESIQQEKIQALLQDEWKKLNVLQLQQKYDEIEQENKSVKEMLSKTRDELQRTQTEKDQFRRDNMRMAQEIDHLKDLKMISNNSKSVESEQLPIAVSININTQESIIDELKDLSPNKITGEQAEKCIREIYHRRTTFNDPDMRKSICGSLKHLGSDLYSSPVHFLHELIQNAEDNFYDTRVIPCLRIELNHNYILLSNNELGIRARDVLAICSLAVSTKTLQQDLIGEKGVGFKSVFAASNQPMLVSHAWKFRFQVPGVDAMSYITPLWIEDQDVPECISKKMLTHPNDTYLYLPLKLQAYTTEAELFLNQVTAAADPCILLNMRRLKMLEIIDERENKVTLIEKQSVESTKLQDQSHVTFEDFSFIDLTGSLIKLCTSAGYNTFRVYTCYIEIPNSIEQRRSPKTQLIMAFPCEADYCLISTVYTGLPVCDLGFNFLFNADFQLVTNRENVRENVPFNTFIRDHLAALFVYLLLNDIDLKKDIHRYCPSTNSHQLRHSPWWLSMVDNINSLITKYLPVLFDIRAGKTIRQFNADLASLVSNEQLYNCAAIQVINSDADFLTAERLKSFQIQSVSIVDILNCFPNRDDTASNSDYRQHFLLWAQNQEKTWWLQFFRHMEQAMTSELANTMLQKPIFLLQNDQQRQYLPIGLNTSFLLFISDDSPLVMWKRQVTLLKYASEPERSALLKSNHVQLLTVERMIEIIRLDHLQLSAWLSNSNTNIQFTEEIWQDLSYLKLHVDKLDKSTPYLVPVEEKPKFATIQKAILPTLLGIRICRYMYSTTSPIVRLPYPNIDPHRLEDILQWEHFLLEMNCQRPSICLEASYKITELPFLPLLTEFTDVKCARLGEMILAAQSENTKDCLRQFPVIDLSTNDQQICPISATFDETIVRDLPSLPTIKIPPYCRALAIDLGVCVEYDLRTCVTILQLLSDEKNTNIDLYIQWLGRLQLYVRQQRENFDSANILQSCRLYLPDQQNFYSLKDLLVTSGEEEYRNGTLLVSKYLQLQWISSTTNQIYWQFKDLFHFLECTCEITINHIYDAIYHASRDKDNFFALGDCKTTLTENGVETMITLYEYLEHLILKCVKKNTDNDLYRVIIENKHPTAPYGSPVDLEWRFRFTCNPVSKQLRKLIGIDSQLERISLPTIDRLLVTKTINNIVYACLETKIIQNLSKDVGKRYYILPSIVRTCPLVIAAFEIDYIERRGKVIWHHKSHNMECNLTQLTNIFRRTSNDHTLQVISANYAAVSLFLSDSTVVEMIDGKYPDDMCDYRVDTSYPFWIFDKIVLLCIGFVTIDSSKAIIATSALATLLYKRNHIPFEEAKSIALQNIANCNEFRSNNIAQVASAESHIFSYTDLLFPTDHHTIESLSIPIGDYCTIEKDVEEAELIDTVAVAADRIAEDRVYRNRAQIQDHTRRNNEKTSNYTNATIVDSIKEIRIGENAEHFFFTYLQRHYGSEDVTPVKNWRSSSRLAVYPQYQRNINDAAGYDFELHDTREIFTKGSGSTTKYCYFEVKGTSGLYDEQHTQFHISQNELEVCQAIATNKTRQEGEAYFIVIIENCLDPENISLATMLEWSSYFDKVRKTVDSYQCKIVPSSSKNISNRLVDQSKDNKYDNQQTMNSNNPNNNFNAQSISKNDDNFTSNVPYPSSQQNQKQQQPTNVDNSRKNVTSQPGATSNVNSLAAELKDFHHQNQTQQQRQSLSAVSSTDNRPNIQSTSAKSTNTTLNPQISPSQQQQQQQSSIVTNNSGNKSNTQSAAAQNASTTSKWQRKSIQQQQPTNARVNKKNVTPQPMSTSTASASVTEPKLSGRQKRKQNQQQSLSITSNADNKSSVQSIPAQSTNTTSATQSPSSQQQCQSSIVVNNSNNKPDAQLTTMQSASTPFGSQNKSIPKQQQQSSTIVNSTNNTSGAQSISAQNVNTAPARENLPSHQQQQRQTSSINTANNIVLNSAQANNAPSAFVHNNTPLQSLQQRPINPNDASINLMWQAMQANYANQQFAYYHPYFHQNQQQPPPPPQQNQMFPQQGSDNQNSSRRRRKRKN